MGSLDAMVVLQPDPLAKDRIGVGDTCMCALTAKSMSVEGEGQRGCLDSSGTQLHELSETFRYAVPGTANLLKKECGGDAAGLPM